VPKIFNRIYNGVQKQVADKPAFARKLFAAGMAAAKKKRGTEPLEAGEVMRLWAADRLIFSKIRKKFGGRLRFAVSGGAALAREVAEFIDALGIEVYEGYGLTETSPIVSANFPGSRKIGSVGKPIAGVRVAIAENGEIVVAGPNVMAGYHNRPEATAEVIDPDGTFRTGDMGMLDGDGFLFITGRIKEQYKLENGKYVVPSPLEEQLKLSPFILNAMIHGDNRPYNVALIVPDPQAADGKDERELRELIAAEIKRCSAGFKGYEKVQEFAVIAEDFTQENGMLTPTLKLKRRNVLARWGEVIESLYR
jgi:long-chain acyl-CoA synthetase